MINSKSRDSVPHIAWLVWGLGALFYASQYMLRIIPSVIQTDLMITFDITAKASGYLGGLFYIPYIALQMPIGALVDRFGARLLLSLSAIFCGLSAFLFAGADDVSILFLSRALLGLFAAAGFVCALKLATLWFPARLLGLVVGITQALGMLGASSGGTLANLNTEYGYPPLFWGLGSLFIIISVSSWFFIIKSPNEKQRQAEGSIKFKSLLSQVLKSPYTWINACYAGLIYAPVQVLGEYWGSLFIENVYGVTDEQAAWAKSMLFVGWFVGGPFAGILADRIGRKPVMMLSAACGALLFGLVFLGPSLSTNALFILFFALGLTNTGLIASYTMSGEMHNAQAAGLSMAITNMFSILFGAMLIPLCGIFLDAVSTGKLSTTGNPIYTADECLVSFAVLPLCSLLAFVLSLFIKETYKPQARI